jgi:hypothetical protein
VKYVKVLTEIIRTGMVVPFQLKEYLFHLIINLYPLLKQSVDAVQDVGEDDLEGYV